ncbi:hypothetical protein DNR46_27065 [Mesorhizobium japonicum]|uniref:Uncharacterized protein n=1 Tax=Mesorhizobium japonicum TaxID=2066070 RepID=A0A3M9X438_9HYPH|nr:hypothetical protein DNR46_27065 [Mesorhizobium japonicum]
MGASTDLTRVTLGKSRVREIPAGFGLTLHEDKTRLIEFGRFAALSRRSLLLCLKTRRSL